MTLTSGHRVGMGSKTLGVSSTKPENPATFPGRGHLLPAPCRAPVPQRCGPTVGTALQSACASTSFPLFLPWATYMPPHGSLSTLCPCQYSLSQTLLLTNISAEMSFLTTFEQILPSTLPPVATMLFCTMYLFTFIALVKICNYPLFPFICCLTC